MYIFHKKYFYTENILSKHFPNNITLNLHNTEYPIYYKYKNK